MWVDCWDFMDIGQKVWLATFLISWLVTELERRGTKLAIKQTIIIIMHYQSRFVALNFE